MNPDFNDALKVSQRMTTASANLHRMSKDVGHARQIKAFIGDMKKNLLAKYVVRALKAGEGVGAAENIARANEEYQRELEALAEQHEASERVIAEFEAEECSFKAAQSLLSYNKSTLEHL